MIVKIFFKIRNNVYKNNHYFFQFFRFVILLIKSKYFLVRIPLMKIKFEYINFSQLWFITAVVDSIIQKDDPINQGKSIYSYKIYIRRNDDCEWFKECCFEDIEKFRNNLIKYFPNVKNIPFPSKNILSYIPFLGKIYGDENNDVLIEKKYVIDNFFNEICAFNQSYKIEEFNRFFTEN